MISQQISKGKSLSTNFANVHVARFFHMMELLMPEPGTINSVHLTTSIAYFAYFASVLLRMSFVFVLIKIYITKFAMIHKCGIFRNICIGASLMWLQVYDEVFPKVICSFAHRGTLFAFVHLDYSSFL